MTDDCTIDGNRRHLSSRDKQALGDIFAHARHELIAHGYGKASIENIACRSGVTNNSVTRLFPTKVALFRGVIADTLDDFLDEMASAVGEEDMAHSLEQILVRCTELLLRRDVVALNRIVIAEQAAYPEIAAAYYEEGVQRVPVALAAWLSWHLGRGALRIDDPNTAATMLVGMMASELQRNAVFGRPTKVTAEDIRQRARLCTTIFLAGCAVH